MRMTLAQLPHRVRLLLHFKAKPMFVPCEQAKRQDYESHCETPAGEALWPVREYRWNFDSVTSPD
jgi:hypothetical protein